MKIVQAGENRQSLERVTVNLIPKAAAALEAGMRVTGHTKTDFINRAIQAYAFLEERAGQGSTLLLRDNSTAELERVLFT